MPASSSRATLIRSAPGPVRPKQLAPSAPGPGRHGPPVAPVRQRAPQPVDVDLIGAVRALGAQGAPTPGLPRAQDHLAVRVRAHGRGRSARLVVGEVEASSGWVDEEADGVGHAAQAGGQVRGVRGLDVGVVGEDGGEVSGEVGLGRRHPARSR